MCTFLPKQRINVTSTTKNRPRQNNRYYNRTSTPAGWVTDYRKKKHTHTHFVSPISLNPEKIIKDSSVRVFIFPIRHKHRGKIEWDCHIHERRWSTHVPFASVSFFLIHTFWFHYHFFSGFSSVHLSFMEMVKRHKNFESYFLRHYVSSNHFFLHFFLLFGLQEEKRHLFVLLNGYGKLTDAAPVSRHTCCRRDIFFFLP